MRAKQTQASSVRTFEADAANVDLRSRCPYFYRFGCIELNLHFHDLGWNKGCGQFLVSEDHLGKIGDRTSGKMLLSTFRMRSHKVSTNRDVYSLGILLLEMTTRKRPTDIMFERVVNLVHIVDPVLLNVDEETTATNHRLKEIVNNISKECLISIARIGVACSMESPQD
ncbi:hypothetical protein Patl1_06604 [Pistacia atlantica]|uniref:Uncharacterized protein n=1 Tax=Pistacia atlantica TaxID=434234 RepID=A0ACC1BQT4_9ROSI|nr:hypothetical protein Patl1_06604 [Pistacia atlantica]